MVAERVALRPQPVLELAALDGQAVGPRLVHPRRSDEPDDLGQGAAVVEQAVADVRRPATRARRTRGGGGRRRSPTAAPRRAAPSCAGRPGRRRGSRWSGSYRSPARRARRRPHRGARPRPPRSGPRRRRGPAARRRDRGPGRGRLTVSMVGMRSAAVAPLPRPTVAGRQGRRRRDAGQPFDRRLLGQLGEVADHGQLPVRERPDEHPGRDREPGQPLAEASQRRIHRVRVETAGDRGHLGERRGVEVDAGGGPEVLLEDGVDLDLVAEDDVEVAGGPASVGRSAQDRSSTGACGGVGAPGCSQVAMPAARNDVSQPARSPRSETARPRISAARARASPNAARSRTRSDSRVGRPASSIDRPPGWAVVRSRTPPDCSTYQSSVLGPPRLDSCRRQPASAAETASTRSGVRVASLSNGPGLTRRG